MAKYSEPFDDSPYYNDDPVGFNQQPQKRKIPAIFGGLLLLVGGSFFVQTTLASNISLNAGPVEFGQGITQAVACDQDVIVRPYSEFINGDSNFTPITLTADSDEITNGRLLYTSGNLSSVKVGDDVQGEGIPADSFITNISFSYFAINNSYSAEITPRILTISRPPGRFLLNAIELSEIDAESCANKALTIKVYNSTDSSPLATYEVFSTGTDVASSSGDIEIDFDSEENATIFLIIEEPTVAATDVYRITIESKDQINLELARIGLWAGAVWCGPSSDEECLIPTSSSEGSEFYCDEMELVCNIVFLPASNLLLQSLIEEDCGDIEECLQSLEALRSATWSISENPTDDPEMGWQILIQLGSFGPFENSLHLDGQILYSNGQYAVFRWYTNTGDRLNPDFDRSYVDLIISFSGSLPITTPYEGELPYAELGDPLFEVPLYGLSWSYETLD